MKLANPALLQTNISRQFPANFGDFPIVFQIGCKRKACWFLSRLIDIFSMALTIASIFSKTILLSDQFSTFIVGRISLSSFDRLAAMLHAKYTIVSGRTTISLPYNFSSSVQVMLSGKAVNFTSNPARHSPVLSLCITRSVLGKVPRTNFWYGVCCDSNAKYVSGSLELIPKTFFIGIRLGLNLLWLIAK